jgi:hypothetical protein
MRIYKNRMALRMRPREKGSEEKKEGKSITGIIFM